MNLHRVTGKSDWAAIAPAKYSGWQRIAARTHGIVTPANVITLIGLAIVGIGVALIVMHTYWWGAALLLVGRLLDLADGIVAHATHTKSQIGELWDATADKLGTLAAIAAIALSGAVPWWVVAALVVPQLIIAIVVLYKKRRGIALHPTRSGKLSMAALWGAMIGVVVIAGVPGVVVIDALTYLLALTSVVLGSYALSQYVTERI